MTDNLHTARLAELRAVAEAAFPVEDWAIWEDLTEGGFVHVGNARGVIPEGEIATSEDAEPNPVAKAYTPELAKHIAAFDLPTVLVFVDELDQAERERDEARAEARFWMDRRATEAQIDQHQRDRADRAEAKLAAVEEALSNHPKCDKYSDDEGISPADGNALYKTCKPLSNGEETMFEPDENGDYRARYRWEPVLKSDGALEVNEYINEKLSETWRLQEEVLTGAVVEALRHKGYVVIEPEEV